MMEFPAYVALCCLTAVKRNSAFPGVVVPLCLALWISSHYHGKFLKRWPSYS